MLDPTLFLKDRDYVSEDEFQTHFFNKHGLGFMREEHDQSLYIDATYSGLVNFANSENNFDQGGINLISDDQDQKSREMRINNNWQFNSHSELREQLFSKSQSRIY
jgi:hypothetical protein